LWPSRRELKGNKASGSGGGIGGIADIPGCSGDPVECPMMPVEKPTGNDHRNQSRAF